MRFSEFSGKEIINLDNGERIGVIGQTDLMVDPGTGKVEAIILPGVSLFGLGKKKEDIIIPWQAIRKIGPEMIIVELSARGFAAE
ncbi:YlmC/YmxH family sporulation protein [Microaerobacter geothermalis]|uniref:YlmC/YmxH family sporulation protein n=1 Tax=Microaerobacter geothermalis TaxID=674972 RepID=UPI001F1F5320|nr:YlmC/YmxH family sporulation protein [Microaerobacter geothermalis]MCF6093179.1 YlmC/YmxH family sporulation protein [Microaerobacter geothermalis]